MKKDPRKFTDVIATNSHPTMQDTSQDAPAAPTPISSLEPGLTPMSTLFAAIMHLLLQLRSRLAYRLSLPPRDATAAAAEAPPAAAPAPPATKFASRQSTVTFLEALPSEIMLDILLKCTTTSLIMLSSTSSRLREAAEDDTLWLLKARSEYEAILPIFSAAPWMPLAASSPGQPTLIRGESPKAFFFTFGTSWMALAARGPEVGLGPGAGLSALP